MKDFLKDYGPAIGPALAFLLGLVALFGKYQVDQWTASWTVERRLIDLKSLVIKSAPPSDFFPRMSPEGLLHADEARNLSNLARFYARLLALKPVFDRIQISIAEAGSPDTVAQFHNMKWWFDILMKRVEAWRSMERFRMSSVDFANLQQEWEYLRDAASSKDPLPYIGRAASNP